MFHVEHLGQRFRWLQDRAAVGCLQGGGLLLFLESALGRDTAGRKQGKKVSRGTFRIVSRGTLFFVK